MIWSSFDANHVDIVDYATSKLPYVVLLPEDSCSKPIPIPGAKHDLEIDIPSYKNSLNCIFSKQRFKLHVEVIDNTGSTTFVLFDWVVSQVVGRSAQSYLDAMSEETTAAECPQDLKMFVDKRMLFKVEVSDANLYRNWRGYTVKKMTMNDRIIKQIIDLHGISLAHEEEEDAYVETHCELADQKPLETVEGVDSSNKDDVDGVESDATPTSKTLGKAVDVSVQSLDDIVLGGCDGLSTKGPKIVPASSAKGSKLVSDGNAKGSKLVSDSNVMDEGSAEDLIVTQTKNPLGKRAVDSVVPVIDVDVGDSVDSTAKEPKLVCVKVEVDE